MNQQLQSALTINAPSIDDVLNASRLELAELSNEKVREIFREICYVPSFSKRRQDIGFRDLRMLQYFGHSLEMAYYDRNNWCICWTTALMLISKYSLLEGPR